MNRGWKGVTVTATGTPQNLDRLQAAATDQRIFEELLPTPQHLLNLAPNRPDWYLTYLTRTYGVTTAHDWREANWGNPWGDVDAVVLNRTATELVIQVQMFRNRATKAWNQIGKLLNLQINTKW